MLYYSFKNYEEFKELFGVEKRSNGAEVRKNKILLAHLKSKKLLHHSIKCNIFDLIHIKDMISLQQVVMFYVLRFGSADGSLPYKVKLMDKTFYSAKYRTDEANGVCVDGDINSIRYENVERGKVYKMKAAKFLRSIVLETYIGQILSEQVINWLCGDVFTQKWGAHASNYVLDLKLHVDDNFEGIYDSEKLEGNFHSCMVNCGYHDFYSNSVSAKAAYLTNIDGKIVSRAIIYTDVKDQDGKTWRLCERQYCSDENELLKRLLVDKLIHGGYIDGYKTIGASCHDSRAFVANDGSSLREKKFKIYCNLGYNDNVSYQDSFKWFDYNGQVAYNYDSYDQMFDLAITGGQIEGCEWDDWNEYYCHETCECFYHGSSYYVNVNDMEDFVYVESIGEYHHKDDVTCCSNCEYYVLNESAFYSNLTEEYYCCEECMEEAEDDYKSHYWCFAEYEGKYYENEEDVVSIMMWMSITQSYEIQTIGKETLNQMKENGEVLFYEDEYYDQWDDNTNLPYNINK